MAENTKIATIKLRRATTAEWAATSYLPADGEPCIEITPSGERKLKIGDGTSVWSALPYVAYNDLADLTDDANHRTVTDAEKAKWSGKQDKLTFDSTPTASSANPVTSGGVKTELDKKANSADLAKIATSGKLADATQDATHRVVTDTEKDKWSGKQDKLTFDSTPTASSANPVTSGGIKTALDGKANTSAVPKKSTDLSDSADLMRYTDTLTIDGGGV